MGGTGKYKYAGIQGGCAYMVRYLGQEQVVNTSSVSGTGSQSICSLKVLRYQYTSMLDRVSVLNGQVQKHCFLLC